MLTTALALALAAAPWTWHAEGGGQVDSDPHGVVNAGVASGAFALELGTDTLEVWWRPERSSGRAWLGLRTQGYASQMFISRLPKVTRPMIAAVDGLAVGVGVTMLLHCDLVYATPSASFRTPFVDLGLIQEAGSSVLGPARLGYGRAFELFVLGDAWGAQRAAEAGLVNAVVAPDELEAKAMAAARRLAAKPRAALLAARRMLKADPGQIAKTIADEVALYKELMRSPEAKEAFTAFLEKRPPDFAKARRRG